MLDESEDPQASYLDWWARAVSRRGRPAGWRELSMSPLLCCSSLSIALLCYQSPIKLGIGGPILRRVQARFVRRFATSGCSTAQDHG